MKGVYMREGKEKRGWVEAEGYKLKNKSKNFKIKSSNFLG
jgi:hypothetical protein